MLTGEEHDPCEVNLEFFPKTQQEEWDKWLVSPGFGPRATVSVSLSLISPECVGNQGEVVIKHSPGIRVNGGVN